MTRLWDFYDGEPWMDNPQLGLLTMNRPTSKRKRGKKMATRRKGRKRRKMSALQRMYFRKGRKRAAPRKRRASRRKRSYRKNWLSPGAVVAANPHRRRRRSKSPRVHHRRRHGYRRNPALLGFGVPGVKTIAFTAVGFVGPSFVVSLANQFVPSIVQTTTSMGVAGKYILKIGSVLGLAWLTRRFVGSNESNMVILGGSVNVGLSLVNDFAPGWLPANPLAMYQPVRPGMRAATMGAYLPTRPGLRALVPNRVTAPRGFIPSASAQGDQGQFGTPARYFRY